MIYGKRIGNIMVRLCAVVCAVLGWWGMIYPDFTLTTDNCRVVNEKGETVTDDAIATGNGLYRSILQADREHVVFKSKAVEALRQWRK